MDFRKIIEPVVAVLLLLSIVGGSLWVLHPFLPAIMLAVILAVSTQALFDGLKQRYAMTSSGAAGIMTLLYALVLFVPLVVVAISLVDVVHEAVTQVRGLLGDAPPAAPEWLQQVPLVGERLVAFWNNFSSNANQLLKTVMPHLPQAAGFVVSAGAGTGQLLMQAAVSLFVIFFLFRDGEFLVSGLRAMVFRLGGERGLHLLEVAGLTMRSVVYGILGAAIAQGLLATAGFLLAGMPAALLLGMAVFLFALIPVGAVQLILMPASAWLIWQGQTGWGIFLLVWGFFVVGNIDNILRPYLISRGAKMPLAVILLGVLGGILSFGLLGLFVGATLLGVCYALIKEWSEESIRLQQAASKTRPENQG